MLSFRPLRSTLELSLRSLRKFDSISSMFLFISTNYNVNVRDIYISYFFYDNRINWETFSVCILDRTSVDSSNLFNIIGYCTFS